ncbi:pyridoxal-phosphate dependent enzyme [Trueperella pecoris]|nr:pyridoxal-phosphate dependent enzyme [Trueperella pecoris]
MKTLGYEIWENLGNTIPDNIVAVAGSGTIALGLDLAFTELTDCREIAAPPRIFIGQPRGWDPIVATITGLGYTQSLRSMLAKGASIAQPVHRLEVADAVVRTGGTGVSINDDIAQSTRYLIGHGLYAEPMSAVAHAAFRKLVRTGSIHASEQTVLILTRTALKATSATRTTLQRH